MLSDCCLSVLSCLSCLSVYDVGVLCQTVGWITMPLGMEVGLGPGHSVRWGPCLPQKGAHPQFSAHVCCDQTTGWIKMPLGREVGLGPGHMVLDGTQISFPHGNGQSSPPLFGRCLLCPNGCPFQQLLSSCTNSFKTDSAVK